MNSIIIIDDELEICESIKMILEYEDYKVDYFTKSSEGLNALRTNSYEVLLLDIPSGDWSSDTKVWQGTPMISMSSSERILMP